MRASLFPLSSLSFSSSSGFICRSKSRSEFGFLLVSLYSKAARADGNFVDLVRVRVRGGAGGNGASGFDRCVRVSRGRPSGGSGGAGGNVVFVPDDALDSLNHLGKMFKGDRGGSGGRNMRGGACGNDCIVRIPLGGVVREVFPDEQEQEEENEDEDEDSEMEDLIKEDAIAATKDQMQQIDGTEEIDQIQQIGQTQEIIFVADQCSADAADDADDTCDADGTCDALPRRVPSRKGRRDRFEKEGLVPLSTFEFNSMRDAPVVVARGGRGGVGNYLYGKNNHECEKGTPGHERVLEIELKTIADVGLVGVPNAGKSSFLAAVSNAHPRIAPYPFTTLNPYVGVIEFSDGRHVTVADIPGLIEGAHCNKGLGHQFLRHIVKARILALVVDFAQPEPWRDIAVLRTELDLYQRGLSTKCKLVIANKADLLDAPTLLSRVETCRQMLRATNTDIEVLPISALHGLAITNITRKMRTIIDNLNCASGSAHRPNNS